MSEVLTFVDAGHLIAKANLWKERARAIQAKDEKLNKVDLKNFPAYERPFSRC